MHREFAMIGRDLLLTGLITTHGGNMSVRVGDRLVITRRGCMLGHIGPDDLIETSLESDDSGLVMASTEVVVHKAIYRETSALAVIHAHPVSAILLSLLEEAIVPADSEGSYLLHKVPVVESARTTGSADAGEMLAGALKEYKIVMLRGHGSFAIGQMLEDALCITSTLEASSRILVEARMIGEDLKEYREYGGDHEGW
jgi:L-fuculose-phosphate aldolase